MKSTHIPHNKLTELKNKLSGELFFDDYTRTLYATDASAYRETPTAIARPKTEEDILLLIDFAKKMNSSLIPRTAGTSLAGQVVGKGIIVDISKHFTKILEINKKEHWVSVQPGVILDELNIEMAKHGLFFGPETSTSNRCMIGGMVGNNSCGAHSLIYGSTRDHTIEIKGYLSDGSPVTFGNITKTAFNEKCTLASLEGNIYRNIRDMLSNTENQKNIHENYPHPNLHRRNTGYAIDLLLNNEIFSDNTTPFNFCQLIAGSEGTLMFITEIKLNLVPVPPKEKALICVHCNTLHETFKANLIALKYHPGAVELMDDIIIEQTKSNITQRKNRFFIEGEPRAILIIEFARNTRTEIEQLAQALEKEMRSAGYGYHFPIVYGSDIPKVWALRKAGLGLLSNIPGDAKPAPVIEDTAVLPEFLPDYMHDFRAMLKELNLNCVFYAHIGTGELHLRPVLNLKDVKDVELFHTVALRTAELVKKYKGSLSGEHGDGRLRGEFIPLMVGQHNYNLLKQLKKTWDEHNILNPGKIVDTPIMNSSLRYLPGQETRDLHTIFDFSKDRGMMRAIEKCNGSGDCRKTEKSGGTMCPSYMATRDERNSTRARANILRETLTKSTKKNPFDHQEIYEVLDLCLSCKGCKSECPSNVDMAKYKAEFLQHYYDAHHIPIRTQLIANITSLNKLGAIWPAIFNFCVENKIIAGTAKKLLGFAPKRTIPTLYKVTLRTWVKKHKQCITNKKGRVHLFCDEFTNYNDTVIGIKAIKLLNALGYEVELPRHNVSGRTFISKGMLRKAKKIANKNVSQLAPIVSEQTPLVGIEPSGILSFRDEYPELVDESLRQEASQLAQNTLLFEEFIEREVKKGNIVSSQFTTKAKKIKLHGHCQQKAVASTKPLNAMLSIPIHYSVEEIPSGCCGMAGSFGYEKEHFDLSMKIGELVLFPAVRQAEHDTKIAAPGTSCRHHIKDGTGHTAYHPIELLYEALNKE